MRIIIACISIFLIFTHVSIVQAASKIGDACNSSPDGLYDSCSDGGLTCDQATLKCTGGNLQDITCGCQNPGKTGLGQNGYSCAGGPVGYCDTPEFACQNVANATSAPADAATQYPGKRLHGFTCTIGASDNKAVCSCIGNGTNQQNNYECHLESDPNVKGTAFCNDQTYQCTNTPGETFFGGRSQEQGDIWQKSNLLMTGIKCAAAEATCKCKTPGVPGSGNNGFDCTQFGQTQTDYCDISEKACTDDPTSVINQSANGVFNRSPLRGVRCDTPVTPTLPPPPSPPCVTWDGAKCVSVQSAFGALSTTPEEFIKTIFGILLGLSGGIALLLILRAGYQMMVSQGKPEQLNAARDQLVAAIVGLVFLIFSFVILQAIGFDILQIPGFGG